MTASAETMPLAIAMSVLVLFVAIGIVLIPFVDALLQREIARYRGGVGKPRNDNELGEAPGSSHLHT